MKECFMRMEYLWYYCYIKNELEVHSMKIYVHEMLEDTRLEFQEGGLLQGFDEEHGEKIRQTEDGWVRILTLCKYIGAQPSDYATHILGHPDGRLAVVKNWEVFAKEVHSDSEVDDYVHIHRDNIIEAAFGILKMNEHVEKEMNEAKERGDEEAYGQLYFQSIGLEQALNFIEDKTKIPLRYMWYKRKNSEGQSMAIKV